MHFDGHTPTMFNNLVDSNVFNELAGTCGATDVEFSIYLATDTATISNNILTMDLADPIPGCGGNASALYSNDNGEGTDSNAGVTYSNNTLSRTGAYASSAYDLLILYDGANNWTIPQLNNPTMCYWQGPANPSATFTGTGTLSCKKYAISTGVLSATWNGAPLQCKM